MDWLLLWFWPTDWPWWKQLLLALVVMVVLAGVLVGLAVWT
jgi:hypothetical protein